MYRLGFLTALTPLGLTGRVDFGCRQHPPLDEWAVQRRALCMIVVSQLVENSDRKGYRFDTQCRHVLIVGHGARIPSMGFEQGTASTNA